MELSALAEGFSAALTPINLLYALLGVTLGTAVGVLPGIGPAMAIALLLPLTSELEVTGALIMFAGMYYGAMYGGSTTSILLNTPGESNSVVTAIEGNRMARIGRAPQALATAALGSFVAGTLGTIGVVILAPVAAQWAISLGAPSYLALMLFSLIMVSAVLGSSKIRGMAALALGLTLGLVGLASGQSRLTFNQLELDDGIEIVLIAVALFAIGEALWVSAHLSRKPTQIISLEKPWLGQQDWQRSWKPWLRGTAIGFPFGVLPAGGAEVPTILSYITEKKLAKHPEEFGHGAIEGVAGPEAANNASAAGTLIPMLALGLPVTATAAIMLGGLTQNGIVPGPLLMVNNPELVWTLIASLFIGNTMLLILNLPLAPIWSKLLHIPRPYLYSGIIFFAILGVYSVNLQVFDLGIVLVLGLLGFAMRRFGLPILPLILGFILGPQIEKQLGRSLQLSGGDLSGLWNEPLAVAVYAILIVALLGSGCRQFVRWNRADDMALATGVQDSP